MLLSSFQVLTMDKTGNILCRFQHNHEFIIHCRIIPFFLLQTSCRETEVRFMAQESNAHHLANIFSINKVKRNVGCICESTRQQQRCSISLQSLVHNYGKREASRWLVGVQARFRPPLTLKSGNFTLWAVENIYSRNMLGTNQLFQYYPEMLIHDCISYSL